jgi:hypothetical protein
LCAQNSDCLSNCCATRTPDNLHICSAASFCP